MEVLEGCRHTGPVTAPNGYANRIFQANMEEGSTDAPEVCGAGHCTSSDAIPNEREEAPRYKKMTKGNRIWNFVRRRKGLTTNKGRPQSMILLGVTSEVSELKKTSFMDRVRLSKKGRTSRMPKNADLRASSVQVACDPEEDQQASGQRAVYRVKKLCDSRRPSRHSYAGYIEDLDSSFEDIELNISIPEVDANESKCLRDISVRLHSEDNDNCYRIPARKSESLNFENFKSSAVTEMDSPKRCTVPQESRRGRSSDVWSYLKGISLTSKDNSKLPDQRAETNFQNLQNITHRSASYFDLDTRCEENLSQRKKSNSATKATHFGGVVRFFTSMAEAARRLRGSSRAFSPDEKRPQRSFRSWRQDAPPHKEGLVIENESAKAFCTVGACLQSPDSGTWDNVSFESLVGKEPMQHCKTTEVSQDVGSSALGSENGRFNETSLSPFRPEPSVSHLLELADDSFTELNTKDTSEDLIDFPQTTLTKRIENSGSTPEKTQVMGEDVPHSQGLPVNNTDTVDLGHSLAADGDFSAVTEALIRPPHTSLTEPDTEDLAGAPVVAKDMDPSPAVAQEFAQTDLDMQDLRSPELPLRDLSRGELGIQDTGSTLEKTQVMGRDLPHSQGLPVDNVGAADLGCSPAADGDFSAVTEAPIHLPQTTLTKLDTEDMACALVIAKAMDPSSSVSQELAKTELDVQDLRHSELPLQDLSRGEPAFQDSSSTLEKTQVMGRDVPCSQDLPVNNVDIVDVGCSPATDGDFSAVSEAPIHLPQTTLTKEIQDTDNTLEKTQVMDRDLPGSEDLTLNNLDAADLGCFPVADVDFSVVTFLKCAPAKGQVLTQTDGHMKKRGTTSFVEQNSVEITDTEEQFNCSDECRPFQVHVSRIVSSGRLKNGKVLGSVVQLNTRELQKSHGQGNRTCGMRKGLLKLTDSLLSHSPSLKHPSVCPACGAGIGEQQQSCQLCQAHSLCAACGIRTADVSSFSTIPTSTTLQSPRGEMLLRTPLAEHPDGAGPVENEQASKTLKVRGNCRNGGRRWNLFKPGAEKLQISRNHSGFHTWIKLGTLTQQRACTWRTSNIKLTEWEADDYISEITCPAMSTSMNRGGLNLLMDYMDCRE
ncbi:hypothetical protein Q9966_001045 [Columba livia]|nr:hypothetical protein Q9966_001045 [Columba livia]